MQKTIEKVFYFSKIEFLVLLVLGHLEEVYSFRLPEKEEFRNEDFILALYQLVKKDCVRIGVGPILTEKMDWILEWIRTAERALVIVPSEDGIQRICYLSEKGVIVTELARQNDEIRLRTFSKDGFREVFFEGTGISGRPVETEAEGQEIEAFHKKMQEERQRILSEEMELLEEDLYACVNWSEVQSAWEVLDLRRKVPLKRLVFRKGCMNTWVLEKTAQGLRLCHDSLEFREELGQELFCVEGKEEKV